MRYIYKEWKSICNQCTFRGKVLGWSHEQSCCPECSAPLTRVSDTPRDTIMIATDELPSGYEARHGVCWPDGTPRRFDSKTELYRALNEKNLKIVGDTPGTAYRVSWSGKVEGRREG